jgi:hypothetical protein
MYYFMIDQVATADTLNSVLIRLRGRYVTLIRNEEKSKSPNEEKIHFYRERCNEITKEYRTIFNQTDSFKDASIEKYSRELNKLKLFS